MYGFLFRPKWIAFHLLVFGAVALMVWLGFWQLRRLDERRAFNEVVIERADEPPVPLDDLLAEADGDLDSIEWRQVTVSGSWLPDQVIWYNRSQDGVAGDNVLSALSEADQADSTVVINRGFVPIANEAPGPPSGEVEVVGRVQLPQVRHDERATGGTDDPPQEPVTEMRRVDLGRLDDQLPGDVAPVYLDLIASVPAVADTGPFPTPLPELSEGNHLSYAAQWFIFSIAALVGWVLAMRKSIATRRSERAAAGAAVTDESAGSMPLDSLPSDDDASATVPN